ncbi:MAG: hypothetical protein Q8K89_05925 [Actinomycetota bacterium]|nr:hypothetical protein [Actinomycetota bacterium]
MTALPILVIGLMLSLAALAGAVADVISLGRGLGRAVPLASLAIKALVVVAFVGYFVVLRLGGFTGWQDLTTFASILVLSAGALVAALVLDVIVVVRLAPRREAEL